MSTPEVFYETGAEAWRKVSHDIHSLDDGLRAAIDAVLDLADELFAHESDLVDAMLKAKIEKLEREKDDLRTIGEGCLIAADQLRDEVSHLKRGFIEATREASEAMGKLHDVTQRGLYLESMNTKCVAANDELRRINESLRSDNSGLRRRLLDQLKEEKERKERERANRNL